MSKAKAKPKKKLGRPPSKAGPRKVTWIAVTEEERSLLRSGAEKEGKPLAEFVRSSALDRATELNGEVVVRGTAAEIKVIQDAADKVKVTAAQFLLRMGLKGR